RSTAYFGEDAITDPMLHTWSLSVEEQFYILFAPTLLVLAVWSMKRGAGELRRRFLAVTLALTLVSFAGCLVLVKHFPLVAFYILPTRAWQFGIGALMVLAVRKVDRMSPVLIEGFSLA